ncbi:MAG TPA: SGNH/GDSL hydrolase family protein [Streptosporangiaceae bacterium]|jgi:lysophospholipase L1-like esterase
MRRVMTALALASAVVTVAAACSSGPGKAPPSPVQVPATYYLSLGDSLAQGYQPGASGRSVVTGQGYADQLYAVLRPRQPGLRLVKLGCGGETTATMIHGGICRYQGGSQLAAAVSFLRAHRARISLVTLDIGANDPQSCLTATSAGKLVSCTVTALPHATSNLKAILGALRRADPGAHIIGMNYYLPALAEWRHGLPGELLARAVELAAAGYNDLLDRDYRDYRVRVADVAGAFASGDFGSPASVPGLGRLPRNVAAVCRWTWECAPPPRGPNEHPNQAGYRVIAQAFLAAGAASARRPER